MIIYIKNESSEPSSFRQEQFWKTFLTPWPTYATNWNGLNNFGRRPLKDHFSKVNMLANDGHFINLLYKSVREIDHLSRIVWQAFH